MPLPGLDQVKTFVPLAPPRAVYLGSAASTAPVCVVKFEMLPALIKTDEKKKVKGNELLRAQLRRSADLAAHLYRHVDRKLLPETKLLDFKGVLEVLSKMKVEDKQHIVDEYWNEKDGYPGHFMMMEFVEDVDNLESGAKLDGLDLSAWQKKWRDLLTKDHFVALGKIAAVDLFLGNEDRFTAELPGESRKKSNVQSGVVNSGNIFFKPTGQAIALDYIDPSSQWKNLYTNQDAVDYSGDIRYRGQILGTELEDRAAFSTAVVKDIFNLIDSDPDDEAGKFLIGLEEGIASLKSCCLDEPIWKTERWSISGRQSGKKVKPMPPQQLWLRAKYIGWKLDD